MVRQILRLIAGQPREIPLTLRQASRLGCDERWHPQPPESALYQGLREDEVLRKVRRR